MTSHPDWQANRPDRKEFYAISRKGNNQTCTTAKKRKFRGPADNPLLFSQWVNEEEEQPNDESATPSVP